MYYEKILILLLVDGTCTYSGNEIKCHENKEINNPGVYAFECESVEDDDNYSIN